jgi:hypothetical protein
VVISAALAVAGCAGVTPVEDPDRRIEAVYDVPGVSQTEIFTATKIWIANNFRSTVSVIKYESAADGILIGNGTVAFPCAGGACAGKGNWTVPFTVRSDMQDGRFRLQFSNVRLKWPATSYGPPPYDGPVRPQENWEPIKSKLLSLGPELAQFIEQSKKRRDSDPLR